MNFFTEVTVCFEKMHEVDEISYVFSQVWLSAFTLKISSFSSYEMVEATMYLNFPCFSNKDLWTTKEWQDLWSETEVFHWISKMYLPYSIEMLNIFLFQSVSFGKLTLHSKVHVWRFYQSFHEESLNDYW
jgi:hypothetical protein